eukprot:1641678-Pyramimonas_sp.AAC.1
MELPVLQLGKGLVQTVHSRVGLADGKSRVFAGVKGAELSVIVLDQTHVGRILVPRVDTDALAFGVGRRIPELL